MWITSLQYILLLQQTRAALVLGLRDRTGTEPVPCIFQGLGSSYYFATNHIQYRKFLVENIFNNSFTRADYRKRNLPAEPLTWRKVNHWWKLNNKSSKTEAWRRPLLEQEVSLVWWLIKALSIATNGKDVNQRLSALSLRQIAWIVPVTLFITLEILKRRGALWE